MSSDGGDGAAAAAPAAIKRSARGFLEMYTEVRFVQWPNVCRLVARILRSHLGRVQVSPQELETARKYSRPPGGPPDDGSFPYVFDVYDDRSSPVTVAILPRLRSDMPASLVYEYRTDRRGL